MEIGTAKTGMRVIVSKTLKGKFSDNTQGWSDGMKNFIGKQQTIRWVSDEGISIKFEGSDFYWDPRDVDEIAPITETLTPTGKKGVFDLNELG
jgi:hypothetical protein